MRELREAIAAQGEAIGEDIIKVDMFLNHRLDTGLIFAMGREFARRFAPLAPELVLTVEASGIAVALAAARALGDLPVVFAKKAAARNQSGDMLTASARSFTHGDERLLRVDRRYLPAGARVLIIDDFLAQGEAAQALMALCAQAGCPVVGLGVCIEKGYQPGGRRLREAGVPVESLAIVTGVENGVIRLAGDD